MKIERKKIFLAIGIVAILAGGYSVYSYMHSKQADAALYQTKEEASDVYVRFAMEAYDKIQANYWGPHDSYNLPQIFELSLEKVFNKQGIANPTDRATTAQAISTALELATSTEAKSNDVASVIAVALYNLQPVGRNGLMSDEQVKSLRDEVSNKDPLTHEIQSTISSKVIGQTLYLDVSQIAPTTLQDFANAVLNSSTTPKLDSMIIDLRGNIGGAMDFLPAFLGLFIGQDQYAFDLYSQGNKNVIRTTFPKAGEVNRFGEIAVLTDEGTQSTAEITTDALKRYHIAKSIGTKTKGWGTIENTYPMETVIDPNVNYTLYLVNSLTVRDDNQPIEGNGVLPDVDISNADWQNRLSSVFHSSSLISAIRQTESVKNN